MAGSTTTILSLDDLHQVAQVLKSNGMDGEFVMSFRGITPEDINLKEPVFIVFDGIPVPFFIESFTKRGNSKALVRITDIKSNEDVEEIAGKAVYMAESSIPGLSIEEDGFAALVGWTLLAPEIPDQVGDDKDNIVGDDQGAVEDDQGAVEDGMDEVRDDKDEVGDDKDNVVGDDNGADDYMSLPALTGNLTPIGQITDFIDIPNNPCIEVETENGAVMIPLHEDLILSIDPEYQEIIMTIPEGLI